MGTFESFESNRWIWRVNIALQILLVVALTALVNYLGMLVYFRHDLTRTRAFSLSAETANEISKLDRTVKVVVTLTPEDNDDTLARAFRDVRGILREFEYAARQAPGGRIEIEFLNVYQQRRRAETLGVVDQPRVVVFSCDGRSRVVELKDLYLVRDGALRQFRGEQVFSSALLEVTSRRRPVLYFLTGHGEMRIDDVDALRGASDLDAELLARNFETRPLDLAAQRRVPDDAEALLILSPATAILPSEEDILRDYLSKRQGRLIIALDPGRPHGLDALLEDWGIQVSDVEIVEPNPAYQIPGGDILIQRFAEHPITQALREFKLSLLIGRARSVRADLGRPIDNSLEVTDLMATSNESWGEAAYRIPGRPRFDPGADIRGPVTAAAVAERKVDAKLGINLRGGRLVVFGGSGFIANHRFKSVGNVTLLFNTINWTIDRDSQIKIPPRQLEQLELTLSQEQLALAGLSILFGPALLVALLGFVVFLARRR